jgi:hypothetical protein
MLAGLQRAFDAPEPASFGVLQVPSTPQVAPVPAAGRPEDDTAVVEQFIELDEVLITSAGLEDEQ